MIAVFILLDAFLGWRLFAGQATAVAPLPASGLVTVGNVNVAGSSVRFEGVLPPAPSRLPTLTVQLEHPDAARIAASLLGPGAQAQNQGAIATYTGASGWLQAANGALLFHRSGGGGSRPLPTTAQARAAADQFLARMALVPADLVFDRVTLVTGTLAVEYYQRYQGQPVFNGRCEVQVDGQGVQSATCIWADALGPADSPRPILAPAEALQDLADARGASAGDPLLVQGVVLGYVAATYEANAAWPTVPAWRVELSDGSLYYVNAYTGTLVPGPV